MNMLVTTEELAAHLRDPEWMIFDTRHDLMDTAKGPREYAQGHIPGAIFRSIESTVEACCPELEPSAASSAPTRSVPALMEVLRSI